MKIFTFFIGILLCSTTLSAQINRSQQPKPGPEPQINFGSPKEYKLSNGLTLLVVENNKLPQVSVSLRIDNPLYTEGDKAGLTNMLTQMMGKGSQKITKDDFEEEIDFMGARLYFNDSGAYAYSLSRYFPRVFEMLASAVLYPDFQQEELDKEKQKSLDALKAGEKDVKTAARRVEDYLSYGAKHPNGEYVTETSLNAIQLGDLKNLYQKIYHAQNAYLVIVGDVDFENVKKRAKKYFGKWKKGKPLQAAFASPKNVLKTEIAFVEMPNAVQSELAVLQTFDLDKNNPDYYAAVLANQIIGGGAEARLFLNLREDKGYTYGAYTQLTETQKTKSRMKAFASVRNEVTDSAVVEIHNEFQRLSKEFVTDEELALVKNKFAGSLIRSLEDPENIARFAYNIKTQNLPKDYYNNLLKNLKKVTKSDIKRVAKKYFKADQMRIVVTGKGSDILAPLEKLKFNNEAVAVSYYDKWGQLIDRPNYETKLPDGITAKTVIEGYLNAIGGREALEKIKTKHAVYEAETQGMTIQMEEKKEVNTKMVLEIKMMGNTVQRFVINEADAYMEAQGQKIPLEGAQKEDMLEGLPLFPELFYTDQIELKGTTMVNDIEAYELKINDTKTAFYDAKSFLKIAENTVQNGMNSTSNFGSYKDVYGILVPETIQASMGPQELTFKLVSMDLNSDFSSTDFE